MVNRELQYPIFLQCIQYTVDPFWKMVFEELAYNVCFMGTSISRGTYYCTIKSKEFSYKFQGVEPKIIFENITLLLQKHSLGGKSDGINCLKEYNEAHHGLIEVIEQDWSDIKKKSIKDLLYQNYLIEMKDLYHLTDIQVKRLYSFINFAILLKTMTNKCVVYTGGRITKIDGLSFSRGKYKIDLDLYTLDRIDTVKKSGAGKGYLGNL